MSKVHLTLQGKGGVGKSYVASLIAQHRMDKGMPVSCIDTDPVNSTFCQYKAFRSPANQAVGRLQGKREIL